MSPPPLDAGTEAHLPRTVTEALVAALAARGVRRIHGVPGGGSSLDVIAAAGARGLRFVLMRNESAAAMAAVAEAELTGAPGVVLTTKGPGVTNAANGIACASLERAPVVLLSDGFSAAQLDWVTHQVFDQRGATAAIAKGYTDLGGDSAAEIERVLRLAETPMRGAVHIDLTGEAARRGTAPAAGGGAAPAAAPPAETDAAALDEARALLARAKRPVVLAGLEAADGASAAALRGLVEALGCPALVTYKAKGVIPDAHPSYVGLFTGGSLEAGCIGEADLILLAGLDPVEMIQQPWRYAAPVLDVALLRHPVHYTAPQAGVYGPLAPAFAALAAGGRRSDWRAAEIAAHRATMRAALAWNGGGQGVTPPRVVQAAQEVTRELGARPRVTVDAGAHMFSATAFWECEAPRDLLISNGLASMAFALPAGIAAALHDPPRGAIAFTGDGGLMMCAGELASAAEAGARLVTVVFNDGALSLIDIKQQQRQMAPEGVRWARADFMKVAEGFGVRGFRAADEAEYRVALRAALAHDGPSLIDVRVDPAGYLAQLQAMRG